MSDRRALEVTVDDAGNVTVHVHELDRRVRRAALEAVATLLGGGPSSASEELPGDEAWRDAWRAELAARVRVIDAGEAKWVSLEDARARLRVAAAGRG